MQQVHWSQPSHPGKIKVVSQRGDYTSYSISLDNFPPGTLLARLEAPTLQLASRAYSSVQVGPKATDNVELNCDFLFINHGCEPNLEFHIVKSDKPLATLTSATQDLSSHDVVIEVRVARRVSEQGMEIGLRKDEPLSFFYPSTEWDMSQPFKCLCGAKKCLSFVRGAKYVDSEALKCHFVNEHIWALKEKQMDQARSGVENSEDGSGHGRGSGSRNGTMSESVIE